MPKPSKSHVNPAFLDTARAFYAEAFDHKRKRDLADSIAEWSEMDEGEQSFAVAHLLFLNLQAQAGTQRILGQVRDLLDEVAESLTTAIEASLPDPDEADRDDDRDEDDDADDAPPAPAAARGANPRPAAVAGDDDADGDEESEDDDAEDDADDEDADSDDAEAGAA
jgi:hypothetical protein